MVIWAAFVALALFYLIPVSAIQALVEVDRLRHIPFFRALVDIEFINAILQSILPSVAPAFPSPPPPCVSQPSSANHCHPCSRQSWPWLQLYHECPPVVSRGSAWTRQNSAMQAIAD